MFNLLAIGALLLAQEFGVQDAPTVKVLAVRPEKAAVMAGETVKVAFDLEITPKWHIYPAVKPLFGKPTVFTFQGAEISGPIEEPKPALHEVKEIDLKYSSHEGKLTITVPVRPAAGARPGPLEVKGKIDYQICDPTQCREGTTPFTFGLTLLEGQAPPAAASDDPPPLKVLSVKPDRSEVKVGETFKVAFEVEVPAKWHIYPTYKSGSGFPTEFKFRDAEVAGKIEETKAKVHPAQGDEPAYDYHEGKVTFTVPFRLKKGVPPGTFEAKGQVDYMICVFNGICVPTDVPASFAVTALQGEVQAEPVAASRPSGPAAGSFLWMLNLAFLGGLLLNIMPCVLPVLTIKLFSLVEQKDGTAGSRPAAALAYTAGVLLCLNAFALAVVVLRSLGQQVGWGFQFQEPGFVIALTTIIFVFALSLMGVFEVPAFATGVAAKAGRHRGLSGHLVTGLFVTLVATPCSAPFLGTGLGFAFTLPGWGIFLFFSAAGLGLALPFLVIGFIPALFRFLPKPGPWLETFKKVMGFTLVATAVWLIDSIASLTGQAGVIGFLAFLTAVSLGAWVYGKWGGPECSSFSRFTSPVVAVALAVLGGSLFLVTDVPEEKPGTAAVFRTEGLDFTKKIPWQPFSEENVAALRGLRRPAFIDFTADW